MTYILLTYHTLFSLMHVSERFCQSYVHVPESITQIRSRHDI